jgi:hypothetical protein
VTDLQASLAIVTTLMGTIAAAFGLPKLWRDHHQYRVERLRVAADQAQKVAQRFPNVPALERFAIQEAIAALVPYAELSHAQRVVLLAQPDAQDAALHWHDKRAWLKVDEQQGLIWRNPTLKDPSARRLRVAFFFVLYAVSVLLAVWPMGLWEWHMASEIVRPKPPLSLLFIQLGNAALFLSIAVGRAAWRAAHRRGTLFGGSSGPAPNPAPATAAVTTAPRRSERSASAAALRVRQVDRPNG